MSQIERALGGYAIPVLLSARLIALVTVLVTSSRRAGWIRSLASGGLAGSVTCVLGVTLSPSIGTPSGIELSPFTNLDSTSGIVQMVGNLVLTVPSGIFCAFVVRDLFRSIRVGCLLCVGVEIAQTVLPIGRIASVEDAIVTTLGWAIGSSAAALAVGVGRGWVRLRATS